MPQLARAVAWLPAAPEAPLGRTLTVGAAACEGPFKGGEHLEMLPSNYEHTEHGGCCDSARLLLAPRILRVRPAVASRARSTRAASSCSSRTSLRGSCPSSRVRQA